MTSTSPLYRAFTALAVPLAPLALRSARAKAAHRARVAAPASLERWAAAHRDTTRPLTWFHASSVGEGLQARAVMQEYRALHPDAQIIYTHFSPSAESLAASMHADYAGYLPYDRRADVLRALRAVRPTTLVFTKLDLWPELATRAAAAGCRVAMVAGTVTLDSSRLRAPARTILAPGYRVLDVVGASAESDAALLIQLGCDPAHVTVTGDPRVDSVLSVMEAAAASPPPVLLGPVDRLMVAGSTWPGDEAVLLEAFGHVQARHRDARLMLVPHEPSLGHLLDIEAAFVPDAVRPPVPLAAREEGDDPEILVIDRVGMLSRLYAAGAMAYVGGGFGRAGIHSVLEPAAWSRPVIIGPNDRGSRDAALLADAGGLTRLPRDGAVANLIERWSFWLDDPAACEAAGAAARRALDSDRGAAIRSAALL
ncbi:MAG: glycosyltransferase N-terminal domain-containing protein [Gemmatimonadota bacterium]